MIAHRPQIAAVVQLQEARAELGNIDFDRALGRTGFTGQTAGHRLFDLMREVIFAFARMPAVARARATSERRLTPCSGSAFSSWLGSTPRSASRRSHSRTNVARPFGEWMRWLLTFIDGHIGLLTSKLKHSPLPLHSIAPRQLLRTAMGICRSQVPRFAASTFIIGASIPSGGQIFPGFRRLSGSKTALILRSSAYSVSPKKAGLYSARNPLPCSPHSRPPSLRRQRYHLVGDLLHQYLLLRIAHVQRRAHVQHPGINVAKHAVA